MSGKVVDIASTSITPDTSSHDSETKHEPHQHTNPIADAATSDGLTVARRGDAVDDATAVQGADGFDAERMRGRSLLTAAEEKALLRRIDWRIMPICSMLFLLKNLDMQNVSNARIMNRGTSQNILTQLHMTSNEYNLLNVLYYVRSPERLFYVDTRRLTDDCPYRYHTSYSKHHRIYFSNDSLRARGNPES